MLSQRIVVPAIGAVLGSNLDDCQRLHQEYLQLKADRAALTEAQMDMEHHEFHFQLAELDYDVRVKQEAMFASWASLNRNWKKITGKSLDLGKQAMLGLSFSAAPMTMAA
jgi:hypothetical protein